MPRGRHRHEQPLHRLLPPAAVAAAALACAGGAWLVGEAGLGDTDTVVLRGLAAAAAVAAVTGAVLTRRWDRRAGRRVSELRARRASAEWRAEEKQAELEAEIEEARELRAALERKLTAKRAELGRLRSEHAALLRRYANAETQRASALEGRRQLELEAAEPTRALTAGAADHRSAAGAPTPLTYLQAREALKHLKSSAERQRRLRAIEAGDDAGADARADARTGVTPGAVSGAGSRPALPGVAATPVPPPRGASGRRLGGGFDFFGSGASSSNSAQRSGSGPASTSSPSASAGQDASADDAEPEPEPAARRAARPAGKVVDLGVDEEALDIAELRGAIS